MFWGESSTPAVEKTKPSRRPRVIIPVTLKPGGLSGFGYHSESTTRSRHAALLRAARSEGFVPIIRRLSLIATFSRYRSPKYSRIFKKDQRWLSDYYAAVKEREGKSQGRSRMSSKLTAAPMSSTRRTGMAPPPDTYEDDEDDWSDDDEEDGSPVMNTMGQDDESPEVDEEEDPDSPYSEDDEDDE
jgi:hypothetical protein